MNKLTCVWRDKIITTTTKTTLVGALLRLGKLRRLTVNESRHSSCSAGAAEDHGLAKINKWLLKQLKNPEPLHSLMTWLKLRYCGDRTLRDRKLEIDMMMRMMTGGRRR